MSKLRMILLVGAFVAITGCSSSGDDSASDSTAGTPPDSGAVATTGSTSDDSPTTTSGVADGKIRCTIDTGEAELDAVAVLLRSDSVSATIDGEVAYSDVGAALGEGQRLVRVRVDGFTEVRDLPNVPGDSSSDGPTWSGYRVGVTTRDGKKVVVRVPLALDTAEDLELDPTALKALKGGCAVMLVGGGGTDVTDTQSTRLVAISGSPGGTPISIATAWDDVVASHEGLNDLIVASRADS